MEKTFIVEFNKRLYKALKFRGITVGAVPDPESTLITDFLLEKGLAEASVINSVLEEVTGVQSLDPTFVSFDGAYIEHITTLVPLNTAREEKVFPVKHEGEYIHMVMAVPRDESSLRRLESVTGSRIKPYSCNGLAIGKTIDQYYSDGNAVAEPVEESYEILEENAHKSLNRLKTAGAGVMQMVNDAHLIRFFQHVMNKLVMSGVSDLHMEPRESEFRIRCRKDGVMQTAWRLPSVFREALLPRIKMLAALDVNQTALPQDGSIGFGIIRDRLVDIRVSTLPSLYGEKIVMRVLERDKKQLELKDLGMDSRDAGLLESTIRNPSGLILVTGPTGSGKSTTLYAVLTALNTDYVNIVTAEDPVEYKLDGLTQVGCSEETGLTFQEALRSFLRQDPDIIMVGEIRDVETADIALKAAMTGHLVLSTLHTNDATGAVTRLTNMGVPPYLVVSSQLTVIAQRLMRRLCEKCKAEYDPEEELLKAIGMAPGEERFYRAVGCEDCSGTGYNGRFGIYEVLQIKDDIVDLILDHSPLSAIRSAAVAAGMTTLREAALRKLSAGSTTVDEVLRVTMDS